MLIVDTIVAWAAEWLLHYEIWLATGEWFGDHEPEHDAPGPLRRPASTVTRRTLTSSPAPGIPGADDAGPRTTRPGEDWIP